METVLGSIDVQLYVDEAPITCLNFLRYVNEGQYDTMLFHRLDPGFVLQGGGFKLSTDPNFLLEQIPNYGPIVNEFSPDRSNVFGTIAMAKLGGDPNSATNQFFFNLGDNSGNLDNQNGGFTVFGEIVDGLDVLAAIEDANTWDFGGAFTDLPTLDSYTSAQYNAGQIPFQSELISNPFVYLLADADSDGDVDAADYLVLKRNLGTTEGATWADGDFDFDGDVDYTDKYLLEFSMGATSDYTPTAVPEPASAALLLCGAGWLVRRRRARSIR